MSGTHHDVTGERIEQLCRELAIEKLKMCQLCGLSYSAANVKASRARGSEKTKQVQSGTIIKMADTLHIRQAWLTDPAETDRWTPAMSAAQAAMRKWAQSVNTQPASQWERHTARRLVMVWEKWHELMPSMREEVWATYLYWSTFKYNRLPSRIEYEAIHNEDWRRCKNGEQEPGEMQLKGAAFVTGLPLTWLQTGDTQYVSDSAPAWLPDLLIAKINGEGADPERLGRLLNAFAHGHRTIKEITDFIEGRYEPPLPPQKKTRKRKTE